MNENKIYLSYSLNNNTPTYGNRTRVAISKLKSKAEGSTVNESIINLPIHAGTHIDFPIHFFAEGDSHNVFDADYWFFNKPILIEVNQTDLVIEEGLIKQLKALDGKKRFDLILVKTGASLYRSEEKYWDNNYGLSPHVAVYIRDNFPNVRMVGMDFISLSSFKHSDIGKEAHLEFLKPSSPILVAEDMDLSKITSETNLLNVTILPLRIDETDGAPVTCVATIQNQK